MFQKYRMLSLLILISLEILAIIYLLNVFHIQNSSIYAVYVDLPNSIFTRQNASDSKFLKYFYLPKTNIYAVKNNSLVGTIVYSSNADGLRGDKNYSQAKPSNVFRIGIFGDSYVYGVYVNDSDTFSKLLENKLNALNCSKKIEVINFGVGGYDLAYTVEMFLQKGKKYNSDLNLFLFRGRSVVFINDLEESIFAEKFANAGQLDSRNSKEELEKVIQIEKEANQEYLENISSMNQDLLFQEYVHNSFASLNQEKNGNSKTVIFTFQIRDKYNLLLRQESQKYNFDFVTLNNFGNDMNDLWNKQFSILSRIDSHPNKLGHRFLADFLYAYLISNNFIPCN